MSTRKSASLDGALLARKGDAVPAIPEPPLLTSVEAPPHTAAPMTGSRRGLAVLVAVALLAVASIAAERLFAPADRMAEVPVAAAPPAEATATEAAVLGAPPDLAAMPHLPPPDALDAPPATDAIPETPADPAPESAPPRAAAITAAVVSDAPRPPVPPAKKAIGRKSAALMPPPASGPYSLQLAAFSSAASARGEAARLQTRLDAVLGDRAVVVVKAGSDRRPVYRLRAGGFPTRAAARAACERIRKLKTGCLVLRR